MKTKQNIGLIECGSALKPINISPSVGSPHNVIKKVLLTDSINKAHIKLKYPSAEVVDDTKAIINDKSIELGISNGLLLVDIVNNIILFFVA